MAEPIALLQFKKITHAAHFAYSMSNHGMDKIAKEIKSIEDINLEANFQIGSRHSGSSPISELRNIDAIEGMVKDGPFSQIIGLSLIVWNYAMWEGTYRTQIATELGVESNLLMCDVMGDLRIIRNWIAHSYSTADSKIKKLKVLKWPKDEGLFFATTDDINHVQDAINNMQVYIIRN